MDLSRRGFLTVVAAVAVGAADESARRAPGRRSLPIATDPFSLGVASGDPHPDSVVLWTRLAPRPLDPGGGLGARSYEVEWQVADDPSMRRAVRSGRIVTRAEHAHSVHVVARGLRPARDHWYRFRCGQWISPVGRTRTAPAPDRHVEHLSWATASCQDWTDGHYTAHRHLADEELDVVIFLGDYIYERPIERSVRMAMGADLAAEADTLERYRLRYGLYKSDPDLQAAHLAAPWIVTCDDHEVQDGYAAAQPGAGSVDDFDRRRRAAYQACWEHQPLRGGPPTGVDLRLHRRATYGDLATFHVLDTRQHRSPVAHGDTWQPRSPAQLDPARTMLGDVQERWLRDGLARSTTRWNIVAQQVLAGRLDLQPGSGDLFNADAWDGYAAPQRRFHSELSRATNPVVLSGDVHAAYALDIERTGGEPIAVELATTSISSGGDGAAVLESGQSFLDANPHLHHVDQRRGYLRCRLVANHLAADFRTVRYVERPGAPVATEGSFVVENGRARLQPTTSSPNATPR